MEHIYKQRDMQYAAPFTYTIHNVHEQTSGRPKMHRLQ